MIMLYYYYYNYYYLFFYFFNLPFYNTAKMLWWTWWKQFMIMQRKIGRCSTYIMENHFAKPVVHATGIFIYKNNNKYLFKLTKDLLKIVEDNLKLRKEEKKEILLH